MQDSQVSTLQAVVLECVSSHFTRPPPCIAEESGTRAERVRIFLCLGLRSVFLRRGFYYVLWLTDSSFSLLSFCFAQYTAVGEVVTNPI